VKAGHKVTVITCAPNHPNGIIYPGYKNRIYQWDELDGIRILRVKTYLSANKGFLKRTLNYVSYMVSATLWSPLVKDVNVVVSTSPQFFCGYSGYIVSRLKRCRWVLEIRDLWPESIIAVDAITNRKVISLLEYLETFMYRNADRIITVTDSFKVHIMGRGINPKRISVVKNGADLERFSPLPKQNAFREQHGLNGKFVASYIGTHGMAHGLNTIFRAAELLKDQSRIVFLLVGDGAERKSLLKQKETRKLDNVVMLPQQERSKMPEIIAASDVNLVLLKKTNLFKTVIPSKIFEAMAMERPIVLGVEGESKSIVEEGECGLCIEPENADELVDMLLKLCGSSEMTAGLGKNGRRFVEKYFNRDVLASDYLALIQNLETA
jgi:glycosyltransferase involved in cell wall biosynthesis